MSQKFDFIVVGAGTAGCLLANRLSGNGKYSIALLEAGGTMMGAAYRHVLRQGNEPMPYCFSGEDTTSGTSKTYKLRCHSSGTSMRFGRSQTNNSAHVFTVVFMEIAQ